MSKAFCLLPHQGNYSSRRSVSRWWFLCPHILSWRTCTAFKWPAQSYFQHQGLEYTSVEAFENLMRATVIAFMARSASDLCVFIYFFRGSDMHIIVFLVCLCWVPNPSRTWDLEMVFDVALFFFCCVYVCISVWGMAHPAGRNPELEKLEYAWSCMRANWAWMEMNEGYIFPCNLVCSLGTSKDPSYHLISLKHFRASVWKNTILVGIGSLHRGACHGVGSKP